jgi:hypothetical protein
MISLHSARFLYNARLSIAMARSRRDLGSTRLWMVEDLLVLFICKEDINLTTGCWSLMEKPTTTRRFPTIWPRCLYNARIWNVMARSRWAMGYSRLWVVLDL